MRRSLAITDLTRMQEERVCVAGYDVDGNCVRPVSPPPGIKESTLYSRGRPIVFPFALVEYNLRRPVPQPPHTEDRRYAPRSARFIERLDEGRRRELLSRSLFADVGALFEVPVLHGPGSYVMCGHCPRSLGAIQPRRLVRVIHERGRDGKWGYRLHFVDNSRIHWKLNVTDLTWRYYVDHLRVEQGGAPATIAADLTQTLTERDVFLRLGLARGWDKFPDRCYIQVTGVHTFPDYLEGRIFADFAPAHVSRT